MQKSAISPGDKFNRLTAVVVVTTNRRGRHWLFKCDCGNDRVALAGRVKFGTVKSCGCLRRELSQLPKYRKHGGIRTPEYRTWTAMWKRCRRADENPRHGGRGISVCDRWKDFAKFLADMGTRPSLKHSLDRIDNDGNYEPSNCRWATAKEQANNRHNSILVSIEGREMSLIDVSASYGIDYRTLYWRFTHNKPLLEAVR